MVGYSSSKPETWAVTNGGYQLRYAAKEIERKIEDGSTVTEWQYRYVNVKSKDRGEVISALISDRYSIDAQLGKMACSRDGDEWADYDAFRQECYGIAEEVC